MLTVCTREEALRLLQNRFFGTAAEAERIPLACAGARILAEDVACPSDVPGFDRATVDGYAVRASDTFGASEANPAVLRLVGQIRMGEPASVRIGPGECAAVPTGGCLPAGADAMIMLEYAEEYAQTERAFFKSAAPGQNIVFRGDDMRGGTRLFGRGRILRSADIGALAAAGHAQVPVMRRLRVAVLSTGDEIVPPDAAPTGASVRDVNGPMLEAALREIQAEPVFYGIVADDPARLCCVMEQAASCCDAVLLSGGSSVGERDCTIRVLGELGVCLFHGLALKPGKPTLAGEIGGKPVIGLPGHPMAAYFLFRVLVRPMLLGMQYAESGERTQPAVLAADIPSNHGREELIPVRLIGNAAHPLMGKSGLIRLLSEADGFLAVPRDTEGILANTSVDVFLW